MNGFIKRLEYLKSEIVNLKSNLNLPQKEQKILELEEQMNQPNFWADNETAQKVSKQYDRLKKIYDFWEDLEKQTVETLEFVKNNNDESKETVEFFSKQVGELEGKYQKNRFLALLNKKYDDHDAIFSIHSGAGGVDAQDWTGMLLRMFLRYAERKGFSAEVLELSRGEQGGVKTAVVEVKGPFAFGLFKSEAGVHRLVRQSPFNPAHTRETSFALLELLPVLEEVDVIKIDDKDLKIETSTASGHGGQSVNTTYSAVRITHIPTGVKVSIQNERSQHQNKETAMKILISRVKVLEEEKQQKQKKEIRGEFKSAEWGNQIRSYILHPYKMVKDHRTGYETTNPDSVLDGELEEFVEKYLEKTVAK